jgi:hypothetical protein
MISLAPTPVIDFWGFLFFFFFVKWWIAEELINQEAKHILECFSDFSRVVIGFDVLLFGI